MSIFYLLLVTCVCNFLNSEYKPTINKIILVIYSKNKKIISRRRVKQKKSTKDIFGYIYSFRWKVNMIFVSIFFSCYLTWLCIFFYSEYKPTINKIIRFTYSKNEKIISRRRVKRQKSTKVILWYTYSFMWKVNMVFVSNFFSCLLTGICKFFYSVYVHTIKIFIWVLYSKK